MIGILGGDIRCPIARSLDVLGEKWTFMILRDALVGSTRFSAFQESLGIPRDVLAARLVTLVEGGVMVRQEYKPAGGRARDEYVLTDAGRELSIVVSALGSWGDRNRPIEEKSSIAFVEESTGNAVDVRFTTDGGRVLQAAEVALVRR